MRHSVRFAALFLFLTLSPLTSFGQDDQIRLNEVDYVGQWVELFNAGTQTVDVSGLFLCSFPNYIPLGNLSVTAGSTTMAPGDFLVVSWAPSSNFTATSGEVGLYASNTTNFGDAASMFDYMEYGSAGHQRESVAVANLFWETGAAVPLAPSGQTLSRNGVNVFGPSHWEATAPSPGTQNQVVTGIEDESATRDAFGLSPAFPNPFSTRTRFTLTVPRRQHVTVEVFNLLGQRVRSLFDGALSPRQPRTFEFDASGLPQGLYVYRARGEGAAASRQVVLVQ